MHAQSTYRQSSPYEWTVRGRTVQSPAPAACPTTEGSAVPSPYCHHVRYQLDATWVPFTADRTLQAAAAIAMEWAERATAVHNRPAVLVTDRIGEYRERVTAPAVVQGGGEAA
jgi:hypothetical protein